MKVIRVVSAFALLAALAGCAGVGVMESGGPLADSRVMPASLPLGAAVDYRWDVGVGYDSKTYESYDGDTSLDISVFKAVATLYSAAIKDDETPYALQPYMQRASYFTAAAGIGSVDSDIGASDSGDIQVVELGGAFISPESGLGVKFASHHEKIYGFDSGGGGRVRSVSGGLIWQNEKGFSCELSMIETGADYYIDDAYSFLAAMGAGFQTTYRGEKVGARQAFLMGSQAIDLEGSVELGNYDILHVAGYEDGSALYSLGVTYYPVKMIGIGANVAFKTFEDDSDIAPGYKLSDQGYTEYGFSLTATVAQRIDIGLSWKTFENGFDESGIPPFYTSDKLGVTVGVRF